MERGGKIWRVSKADDLRTKALRRKKSGSGEIERKDDPSFRHAKGQEFRDWRGRAPPIRRRTAGRIYGGGKAAVQGGREEAVRFSTRRTSGIKGKRGFFRRGGGGSAQEKRDLYRTHTGDVHPESVLPWQERGRNLLSERARG